MFLNWLVSTVTKYIHSTLGAEALLPGYSIGELESLSLLANVGAAPKSRVRTCIHIYIYICTYEEHVYILCKIIYLFRTIYI